MDEAASPATSSSISREIFTQGNPDHARLTHGARVALGSVVVIVLIIVAVIGLWRQAQWERKARRKPASRGQRIDLMRSVMPPDPEGPGDPSQASPGERRADDGKSDR